MQKSLQPECQKCYQKGHWTYQCKNTPLYLSRPSRTQILKNPLLKPKLLNDDNIPEIPRITDGDFIRDRLLFNQYLEKKKLQNMLTNISKKTSKRRKVSASKRDISSSSRSSSGSSETASSSDTSTSYSCSTTSDNSDTEYSSVVSEASSSSSTSSSRTSSTFSDSSSSSRRIRTSRSRLMISKHNRDKDKCNQKVDNECQNNKLSRKTTRSNQIKKGAKKV